jgi:hypothetical protein
MLEHLGIPCSGCLGAVYQLGKAELADITHRHGGVHPARRDFVLCNMLRGGVAGEGVGK